MQAENVVDLGRERLMRQVIAELKSPYTKGIIKEGAGREFRALISPVLRDLLEAKGCSDEFQREVISLLTDVYANFHTQPEKRAIQHR